ncbi:MAG: alpha/beta fold hydrolase [SAR202 cluster bacterium]|jgi:pimeloyl-ACP methyl ester carboxylesterase/DNA-binding CsgD family transcriptional regulator|nr:alpha/beta fold hydrolase [SAR202 cluster bacterium]MQG67522.1 alpha/beta fold hydrolase [SAR202 cluster bacterium]HAL46385.1 helix-turn-helix transcriptional regulator [Dehalococcoidia bacterium]|tara:strand:+ start:484 stop:1578 length:1095 start_codon:yes stop_codon:yes gene_type:complete
MMNQEIRFCTAADGTRIAYAIVGDGPPLVKAPNWLTHLEFEWNSPVWRHWWEELARDYTLIRFDQRGSGFSDRTVIEQSFDTWVGDLGAVVDDIGLDRFSLFGISQGGAIATTYIVRNPGRVDRLVLYGAYPRGEAKRGGTTPEEFEAVQTLTRAGWGRDDPTYRQMFTSRFMPGATTEQMAWFNDLQRVSTSGENAALVRATNAEIDVLPILGSVDVPTLVLHAQGDTQVPFEQGRQLASLIPGARFVGLDGSNHLLLASEPAWPVALAEIRAFLSGEPESRDVAPASHEVDVGAVTPVPADLTPREVEVLRLLAAGQTNRDIAAELFITTNTVANHVKNILSKTDSANRTEAAAFAARHGLN